MKRHIVVGQVEWYSLVPIYGISLTIIGAFDYGKSLHTYYNICNLVILYQPATLIYCLVFSSEPFFAHKLECKYYVSLRINAKHIANYYAALYLVQRYIQYITRSRFCLNCQKGADVIVNCHNIRKTRAASAQSPGTPLPVI